MRYQIITDSACDLNAAMQTQLNVTVVPLVVNFRGEARQDSVEDRDVSELYDGMRAGEVPTTSAINPDGWEKAMEAVLAADEDVLVMTFSSGLSTTYQSAMIAANDLKEKYPQRQIRVVDTGCAALGSGLMVWYACKKRDEGLTLEELTAWVENNKLHLCHWFTVDDLVYLKRGGRVSAASAVLGAMLNIKPVLHVDNDGHLISMSKVRGRKASIEALAKQFDALRGDYKNEMIFISQADCMGDAEKLKAMLLQRGFANVVISNLGAVIGAHAGPGTLALFFMGDHR